MRMKNILGWAGLINLLVGNILVILALVGAFSTFTLPIAALVFAGFIIVAIIFLEVALRMK